jgi:hypothetical protein
MIAQHRDARQHTLNGKARRVNKMYNNDGRVLVIGESGSDNATRSRIKIDATNRRNSGRLQCKNNAKFSDCFTGSRKSFIIKGRGSSVVEQPIRNRQVASSTLALGSNSKKTNEFLKPVTSELTGVRVPSKFHRSFLGAVASQNAIRHQCL